MRGIVTVFARACVSLFLLLLLIYLVGVIKDFVLRLIYEYEVKKWIKENHKKRDSEKERL